MFSKGDELAEHTGIIVRVLNVGQYLDAARERYYTVRVLRGGTFDTIFRTVTLRHGESVVISERTLQHWKIEMYRNVPVGICPECEEEDSIFYGEDYMCALCRERLEEGLIPSRRCK